MDNIKQWAFLSMSELPQGPPAEKTGEGSLVNRSSCPTDGPVGQWAELNYVQRAGWPFPLQRLLDGLVIIVIIFVTCDD